jgi:hypothetical protein
MQKPSPEPQIGSRTISRVLYHSALAGGMATVIPLGAQLPVPSSNPEALIGPIRFPIWSCFERGLPSSSRHRADWWALTPPFHPYRPKAAVCFLWRSPRITPPGRYPASCPVKPGLSSPSVTPKRDGRGDNPSGSRKLKNYSAWCAISSAVWLVSSLKCSTQ